jgi:hypothetical protein
MASNQQNIEQGNEQRAGADAPLSAPAAGAPAHGPKQAETAEGSLEQGGDGRFEVAEEVSLDQQSDSARRVGQAPADVPGAAGASATEAMAETVQGEAGKADQPGELKKAVERAVPPPGSWT